MADYAKKTCNLCGLRDIQPNMVRAEKQVRTGSSKQGVDAGTIFGVLAGRQDSGKRVQKVLFNNNKRNYTRKSIVWMCPDCAGVKSEKQQEDSKERSETFAKIMGWFLAFVIVFAFNYEEIMGFLK